MSQPEIKLLDELIEQQQKKVLELGRTFVSTLTEEDVLQPMDYPELEHNPYFRHEEGILSGLHSARTALLAHLKESPQ